MFKKVKGEVKKDPFVEDKVYKLGRYKLPDVKKVAQN